MYFSKFPLIKYIYLDKENFLKQKLATNILKRVGFSELSRKDKDHFITYTVVEGEKPEVIADKLYDNPELHWLVLLFNNIVNPYKDWPMSSYDVDNFVEKKYNGYSLFLSDSENNHPSTIDFHTNQTIANTSGGQDVHGIYVLGSRRARVKNWDTQYSRLDIEKTEDEPNWTVGEYVVGIGSTGQPVVGKIQRIAFHSEAVHHFERQEGLGATGEYVWLNPLGSTELSGQIPLGATGATFGVGNTGTGVYQDAGPEFYQTLVGEYMGVVGSDNNNNVVTNRQYEYRLNNKKKTIKLLDPDYVPLAVNELEKLLKVKGLVT
jgi:hypothetical protein